MMTHRVIYNQDCTNLFACTAEPLEPRHVDRMVDEVAEGGADLMLINPNAQRLNYPGRAWQTFWEGYAPGHRAFFGPVADKDVAVREAWVVQMKRLADQGCNYLTRALGRCRQKGIAPGISVRMNDMHDAPTPGTHLFSRFYMEHPELHLANPPICSWSATGLNYEHRAVRDHYLALIRELVEDYDLDVLELDFLRFSSYFPRDAFERHCDIMTGFIREVHALVADSGRRIALMARVPATPASAYELGFDVAAWADEGLIEGISAGAFLNTQWWVPVDEFRALVRKSVSVYACADYPADRRPHLPLRGLPTNPALLRGFAAGHLAAGAHGVELFNFFCAREPAWESPPKEPSFATLRELRDPAALRSRSRIHTLTAGWAIGETDGVLQVPQVVKRSEPRAFQMLLADGPDTMDVQVIVVFTGTGNSRQDQLWLHVNHVPAGPACSLAELPAQEKGVRQAIFKVPTGALRDGRNTLILRNEGDTLTVLTLEVHVTPQG